MPRESWHEMAERHRKSVAEFDAQKERERHALIVANQAERLQVVEEMAAQNLSKTKAARELGITLRCLSNFTQRYGVEWPHYQQGIPA